MIKKTILSVFALVYIANAEEVSIKIPEAVALNHKLIKNLYLKIDSMEKRIEELERKEILKNVKTSEKTSEKTNKMDFKETKAEENKKYFISYETANIKAKPALNSAIKESISFGEEIKCEKIDTEWCKISNNEYIYVKSISKIKRKPVIITRDTKLREIKNTNIEGRRVLKGSVLETKGFIKNKWFVTENNFLIDKNDAISSNGKR